MMQDIEKVLEKARKLNQEKGNWNLIDVAILLDDLRKVYKELTLWRATQLQQTSSEVEKNLPKNETEMPATANPQPKEQREPRAVEALLPWLKPAESDKDTEKPDLPLLNQARPKPVAQTDSTPVPSTRPSEIISSETPSQYAPEKGKGKDRGNETWPKMDTRTYLGIDHSKKAASHAERSFIKTLGINDRIRYQQELFAGDSDGFEYTCQQLSGYHTIEEASLWLKIHVMPLYNWEKLESVREEFLADLAHYYKA